jgi:hypothetical protein
VKIILVTVLAAGCSKAESATYCDEDKPCTDPVLSFCDLTGQQGAANQCVAPVDDGGAGAQADAATDPDARPPGEIDASDLCADVDCSALDDACNRGTCIPDTGACTVQPINEDMPCADPICGPLGACGGFSSFCDEVGTAERTCQDLTCQAGACVAGAEYEDDQACERNTDGMTCDDTTNTCTPCGGFGSICDESGTRTCTRTTFTCAASECAPSATPTQQTCSRDTDGTSCGTQPCNFNQGTIPLCCNAGGCSVTCGSCTTPAAPIFR